MASINSQYGIKYYIRDSEKVSKDNITLSIWKQITYGIFHSEGRVTSRLHLYSIAITMASINSQYGIKYYIRDSEKVSKDNITLFIWKQMTYGIFHSEGRVTSRLHLCSIAITMAS